MAEAEVMPADAQGHTHHSPLLRQQGAYPDGVVGQEEARQELGVVADGRAVVRAQRDDGHAVADALRARPAAVLRDEHAAPEARREHGAWQGGTHLIVGHGRVAAVSTMQHGRPQTRRGQDAEDCHLWSSAKHHVPSPSS